jgi:flagellar biosynthesis/type III secretory pathway chaperone
MEKLIGDNMADYLELLEESLVKKIKVLDEIGEFNLKQKSLFTTYSERPDFDRFDEYIEEKDRLINELNLLDEGFEALYERVAETLKTDREANAPRIKRLQNLIREITDKSSTLQAQEAENKKLMEGYFKNVRSGIGKERTSLNAAYSYMQSQRMGGVESLYMDSKK